MEQRKTEAAGSVDIVSGGGGGGPVLSKLITHWVVLSLPCPLHIVIYWDY